MLLYVFKDIAVEDIDMQCHIVCGLERPPNHKPVISVTLNTFNSPRGTCLAIRMGPIFLLAFMALPQLFNLQSRRCFLSPSMLVYIE